jgi:hypothetical protein
MGFVDELLIRLATGQPLSPEYRILDNEVSVPGGRSGQLPPSGSDFNFAEFVIWVSAIPSTPVQTRIRRRRVPSRR